MPEDKGEDIYAKYIKKIDAMNVLNRKYSNCWQKHGKKNPVVRQQIQNSSTMNLYKFTLRKFVRFLYGIKKRGVYPDCVAGLKINRICRAQERSLQAKDLLTSEEIKQIIGCTANTRDRAMLSLLSENGARLGELCNLNIGDLTFCGNYFKVNLNGKTGKREVPAVACMESIKAWLNEYPYRTNANRQNLPLFVTIREKDKTATRISSNRVAWIIQRAATCPRKW
ncbi:MAG: tyrosine-type recombinase/integrase [Candidatus Aenigmarchaeota archaeon]|nr:tyrosine-type recombinase/integrase [Candidatus Aenigmarchaeota archaeon]